MKKKFRKRDMIHVPPQMVYDGPDDSAIILIILLILMLML
jgi:hypothetical protein